MFSIFAGHVFSWLQVRDVVVIVQYQLFMMRRNYRTAQREDFELQAPERECVERELKSRSHLG